MERRTAVWMAEDQLELVRHVAAAAGLTIVSAGCGARGKSTAIAESLDAKPLTDLRAALASSETDLFWIASPGAFGAGGAVEDSNAVADAHARGVTIATIEPLPAAALDLQGGGWIEGAIKPVDIVRTVPRLRDSESFRNATELLQTFGPARTVHVESCGGSPEGSLGSHLYSALDAVYSLMGEPETIDAACAVLSAGKTVRAMPGESLRDLHGDVTASLRFADGRAAGLLVSNQAGRWHRQITLLGERGRLRIFDGGLEWITPEGSIADETKPKRARKGQASPAVSALADSLSRMLDPGLKEAAPSSHVAVLTLAQTALLSARTGQGESPSTIRRMVGIE